MFLFICWLTIPMISAIYGSLGRADAAGVIDIQHIDIQRFRSIVVEDSFYSVDPLNILLVRNILLLILWLAILLAPVKERNGGV